MIRASNSSSSFKSLLQHVGYIFCSAKFLYSASKNRCSSGSYCSLRIAARITAHIDYVTIGHLYNASSAVIRTRMLIADLRITCHNVSQTSTVLLVKSNGNSVCNWNVQSLRIKLKSNDMSNGKVAQSYINLYASRFLYIGQAFRYSPENTFYIFNQQIYFII